MMVTDLLRSRSPTGAAAPPAARLFLARRGDAETWLPAAPPASVVSGGAPNTFGAWVSLGTPLSDFYTSHVWACLTTVPPNAEAVLVECAYGAGRTPVDADRGLVALIDPTADAVGFVPFPLPCRPVRVPGGQEVWVRGWANLATQTIQVMVAGWLGYYPVWDVLPANTVTGPGRYYPTNVSNVGISVVPGVWGAWGAPVTVVDPAPNDLLVVQALYPYHGGALLAAALALEVGYGPAGAETWCATVLMGHDSPGAWVWPPVWVNAGERLAVRAQAGVVAGRPVLLKVYDL